MSNMAVITHKRGDTLSPTCNYYEADGKTPASLVGVTIRSQLRDQDDNLVHEFVVQITNAAAGEYSMSPFITNALALADYLWDIEYTHNGVVDHTDTMQLILVKTVTQPA